MKIMIYIHAEDNLPVCVGEGDVIISTEGMLVVLVSIVSIVLVAVEIIIVDDSFVPNDNALLVDLESVEIAIVESSLTDNDALFLVVDVDACNGGSSRGGGGTPSLQYFFTSECLPMCGARSMTDFVSGDKEFFVEDRI